MTLLLEPRGIEPAATIRRAKHATLVGRTHNWIVTSGNYEWIFRTWADAVEFVRENERHPVSTIGLVAVQRRDPHIQPISTETLTKMRTWIQNRRAEKETP